MDFQYEEPTVMKESGRLNGGSIDLEFKTESNSIYGLFLEYHTGSITYDGKVCSLSGTNCTPFSTNGKDSIINAKLLYGRNISLKTNQLSLYSGTGYKVLKDSTEGDSTYDREITHIYMPIGLKWEFHIGKKWAIRTNLEYDYLILGQVESKLSQASSSLPDIKNIQKTGYGYQFSLGLGRHSKSVGIFVNLFYRIWDFAQSESYDLISSSTTYSFVEPENNTKILGLNLSFRF